MGISIIREQEIKKLLDAFSRDLAANEYVNVRRGDRSGCPVRVSKNVKPEIILAVLQCDVKFSTSLRCFRVCKFKTVVFCADAPASPL
jgi:hypothetical protein